MYDLAPNNPYTLRLSSPLIAAAGSLGYGIEVARTLGFASGSAHGLGALVTRTTTLQPRRGPSSLSETPAGLVYAGTANPGIQMVARKIAPAWTSWQLPIILSVSSAELAEFDPLFSVVDQIEGLRGIELALSQRDDLNSALVTSQVAAVRQRTPLPLLVKLPGLAADLLDLAQAAVAAGADTLVVSGSPAAVGASRPGHLVGPAIYPLTLHAVSRLAPTVAVPLVAVGGVASVSMAQSLVAAGATVVGLGSMLLSDLRLPARMRAAW